jgi:hypothetical protein
MNRDFPLDALKDILEILYELDADDLHLLDEKDDCNRVEEYEKRCCLPYGTFIPPHNGKDWEFSIKCGPAGPMFVMPDSCKCDYTLAIKKFKEKFL